MGRYLSYSTAKARTKLGWAPVLGYRERMELASVALARGVPYLGSDFRLDPPIWGPPLDAPTVASVPGLGWNREPNGRPYGCAGP